MFLRILESGPITELEGKNSLSMVSPEGISNVSSSETSLLFIDDVSYPVNSKRSHTPFSGSSPQDLVPGQNSLCHPYGFVPGYCSSLSVVS